MSNQFGTYSKYYDLFYQDKDYRAEAEYVCSLLNRYVQGAKTILELGCGTGRHAEILASRGYDVVGVERSETMLQSAAVRARMREASSEAGQFTTHLADAREFRVSAKFDAVLSLFHVVSYQTTHADVQQLFDTVSHHLHCGGVFIFDVWYGPAVLTQRPSVRVKRMANDQIEVFRIAEPLIDLNRNIVSVTYTVFLKSKSTLSIESFTEHHVMRYFFMPEIELIAKAHGFELMLAEEWLTANQPSDSSWGVTLVARKTS